MSFLSPKRETLGAIGYIGGGAAFVTNLVQLSLADGSRVEPKTTLTTEEKERREKQWKQKLENDRQGQPKTKEPQENLYLDFDSFYGSVCGKPTVNGDLLYTVVTTLEALFKYPALYYLICKILWSFSTLLNLSQGIDLNSHEVVFSKVLNGFTAEVPMSALVTAVRASVLLIKGKAIAISSKHIIACQ